MDGGRFGTLSVIGRRIAICGTRGLIVVGANVCSGLELLIYTLTSHFRSLQQTCRTLRGASPFAFTNNTKYSKYNMAHYHKVPYSEHYTLI